MNAGAAILVRAVLLITSAAVSTTSCSRQDSTPVTQSKPGPASTTSEAPSPLEMVKMAAAPSAPESGEQDCTRGDPQPLLATVPGRAQPEYHRMSAQEAFEKLAIDAQTSLSLRQFGCSHYALEFTFLTKGILTERPQESFTRISRLLAGLPVAKSHEQVVANLADFLKKNASDTYKSGDPLQMSEAETVSVDMEHRPSQTKIVILYDVAL